MKIIIAGAGRVGYVVAQSLEAEGHDVTLIDRDAETIEQIERLVSEPTFLCVLAERAMLAELRGGCIAPIGAKGSFVRLDDGTELLALEAQILSFDGLKSFQTTSIQTLDPKKFGGSLPFETQKGLAELLGKGAAQALIEQGASELVEEIGRARIERDEKLRKRSRAPER